MLATSDRCEPLVVAMNFSTLPLQTVVTNISTTLAKRSRRTPACACTYNPTKSTSSDMGPDSRPLPSPNRIIVMKLEWK